MNGRMMAKDKKLHLYPAWTTEFHCLHAFFRARNSFRKFCWFVAILASIIIGIYMTVNVVLEYWSAPTATRISLEPVQQLQLPRISFCPRNPDAFHKKELFADMRSKLGPDVTDSNLTDLVVFFAGGSGWKNVDYYMSDYNWTSSTILGLQELYNVWRGNESRYDFFYRIMDKYSYRCQEMFLSCTLGPNKLNCCEFFKLRYIMNRGKCYSANELWQADADEIGKLAVKLKQLPSLAMSTNGLQTQMMVYISNNSSVDIDEFNRYYIDMNVYNRMRFTAQRIRFLPESTVCTENELLIGDTCYVRQWYEHDVLGRYNCSFAYMHQDYPSSYPVCPAVAVISSYYYNSTTYEDRCMMGCDRWNYDTQNMVYSGADRFKDFKFSLEASFTNLQYEDYEQIQTITIFGLIAQMGGQLGLFAGMSLLTIVQIIVYYIYKAVRVLNQIIQLTELRPPIRPRTPPQEIYHVNGVPKYSLQF